MRSFLYKILNILTPGADFFLRNKLRVLAYHSVPDPEKFDEHLSYLKRNYNIIGLKELKEFLFENIELPDKSLLITFDDGDITVLQKGMPLLQKYKLPAVLFIITELIDTDKAFWWDEIEYYLGKSEGNKKVWEVKEWTNDKRQAYLDELRNNSTKPPLHCRQLTSSELELMEENRITIANHSHTHPMFNQCTYKELELEMKNSKSFLESRGFKENVFAYPNGNYSKLTEQLIKKNGIEMAFLFDHKLNNRQIHPLRISRISVDSDLDLEEFKVKISGLHSFILHKFKKTSR